MELNPKSIFYNKFNFFKSIFKLYLCQKKTFKLENLSEKIKINEIFNDKKINDNYLKDENLIKKSNIPNLKGGVNEGDRKALYFLINKIQPNNILEIGTHIGSSTLSLALAAKRYGGKIDTVDIIDVNKEEISYWKKYNSQNSPKKNLKNNNCEDLVNFITSDSIDYLEGSKKKYNFIFLDGSHSSDQVYKEISLALDILDKKGIILLHDYFPKGEILWHETKKIIYGPYLAIRRILKEENIIKVEPLDNLPWKTKFNSNKSSLAILYK